MNSYFNNINPKSIHIIFDKNSNNKKYKIVISTKLDQHSQKLQRQSPPNLSLAPAGEWEKEYPHFLTINTHKIRFNLNSIIDKSSVSVLSYT